MRRTFILLVSCLLPLCATAQYWRVQASGGIATSLVRRPTQIFIGQYIPNYVSPGYYASHIPEQELPFATGSLALLRRFGSLEAGIKADMFTLRRSNSWRYDPNPAGSQQYSEGYSLQVKIPAIPVTAVCNYYAGPKRSSGFAGLHAGAVYVAGKDQQDFDQMVAASDITIRYRSTWGFCIGAQAGYRKEFGPVDAGFQLEAKYMQFSLQHGLSATRYPTKLFVFPAQLYVGYRFGLRKEKAAPKPETPTE